MADFSPVYMSYANQEITMTCMMPQRKKLLPILIKSANFIADMEKLITFN